MLRQGKNSKCERQHKKISLTKQPVIYSLNCTSGEGSGHAFCMAGPPPMPAQCAFFLVTVFFKYDRL